MEKTSQPKGNKNQNYTMSSSGVTVTFEDVESSSTVDAGVPSLQQYDAATSRSSSDWIPSGASRPPQPQHRTRRVLSPPSTAPPPGALSASPPRGGSYAMQQQQRLLHEAHDTRRGDDVSVSYVAVSSALSSPARRRPAEVGIVDESLPPPQTAATPLSNTTATTMNDVPLSSRDELLKFIKAKLQPHYNKGEMTKPQFVAISKNTLHFIMRHPVGSSAWGRAFVQSAVQMQLELVMSANSEQGVEGGVMAAERSTSASLRFVENNAALSSAAAVTAAPPLAEVSYNGGGVAAPSSVSRRVAGQAIPTLVDNQPAKTPSRQIQHQQQYPQQHYVVADIPSPQPVPPPHYREKAERTTNPVKSAATNSGTSAGGGVSFESHRNSLKHLKQRLQTSVNVMKSPQPAVTPRVRPTAKPQQQRGYGYDHTTPVASQHHGAPPVFFDPPSPERDARRREARNAKTRAEMDALYLGSRAPTQTHSAETRSPERQHPPQSYAAQHEQRRLTTTPPAPAVSDKFPSDELVLIDDGPGVPQAQDPVPSTQTMMLNIEQRQSLSLEESSERSLLYQQEAQGYLFLATMERNEFMSRGLHTQQLKMQQVQQVQQRRVDTTGPVTLHYDDHHHHHQPSDEHVIDMDDIDEAQHELNDDDEVKAGAGEVGQAFTPHDPTSPEAATILQEIDDENKEIERLFESVKRKGEAVQQIIEARKGRGEVLGQSTRVPPEVLAAKMRQDRVKATSQQPEYQRDGEGSPRTMKETQQKLLQLARHHSHVESPLRRPGGTSTMHRNASPASMETRRRGRYRSPGSGGVYGTTTPVRTPVAQRTGTPTRGARSGTTTNAPTPANRRTPQRNGRATVPPSSAPKPPTRLQVVEHIRLVLQPAYDQGALPKSKFAEVVRTVSTDFFSRSCWRTGTVEDDQVWQSFLEDRLVDIVANNGRTK